LEAERRLGFEMANVATELHGVIALGPGERICILEQTGLGRRGQTVGVKAAQLLKSNSERPLKNRFCSPCKPLLAANA
jgi:hypothetical protein